MRTIQEAGKYSIYNREQIENSSIWGCYYCLEIFKPEEVKDWADGGRTALCPHCWIDSVLGDTSGFELNKEVLEKIHKYRF